MAEKTPMTDELVHLIRQIPMTRGESEVALKDNIFGKIWNLEKERDEAMVELAAAKEQLANVKPSGGEVLWIIERTYARGRPAEQVEFWRGSRIQPDDSFGGCADGKGCIWTTNVLEAARFPLESVAKSLVYEFHPEARIRAVDHVFGCGPTHDQIDCANYLKEGETIPERMERFQKDIDGMLHDIDEFIGEKNG